MLWSRQTQAVFIRVLHFVEVIHGVSVVQTIPVGVGHELLERLDAGCKEWLCRVNERITFHLKSVWYFGHYESDFPWPPVCGVVVRAIPDGLVSFGGEVFVEPPAQFV